MKLSPTMDSADSVLRTGAIFGDSAATAWNKAKSRAQIVQSNIDFESRFEPRIDFIGIEKRARAARNVWIGSKLKSYYEALVRKFARAGKAESENYLGASHCLADLEERIRCEERKQSR